MIEKGLRLVNRRKKELHPKLQPLLAFSKLDPRARRLQFMLSLLAGKPSTNMIDGQQFSKLRLSDSSLSLSVRARFSGASFPTDP